MKKQNIVLKFFSHGHEMVEYTTNLAPEMLNKDLLDDISFPEEAYADKARVYVDDKFYHEIPYEL